MERRWKVLAAVSVAVFVVGLDMFIVNIAFPDIERDFDGASVASISWVLNAYAIVLAALMVPAGRTADRIGRRRGFLIGLIVFVLGSALCGAAPSVGTLVAARAIQAAGAAVTGQRCGRGAATGALRHRLRRGHDVASDRLRARRRHLRRGAGDRRRGRSRRLVRVAAHGDRRRARGPRRRRDRADPSPRARQQPSSASRAPAALSVQEGGS